jgi:hypothetical protein
MCTGDTHYSQNKKWLWLLKLLGTQEAMALSPTAGDRATKGERKDGCNTFDIPKWSDVYQVIQTENSGPFKLWDSYGILSNSRFADPNICFVSDQQPSWVDRGIKLVDGHAWFTINYKQQNIIY